ncbi:MAG TPA: outer membrane lipid asymmetry maintenance protein MlaD [Desulfobacteraceae bacterium]|nr:outer membrane lipid asymmetry maintenance protein MlaD [Desulfobacteraceae bacterium]|tara:strand:- start:701 stop:1153 length:453 start_codon:yes stop_codon:yes gene_type:complete
MKKKNIELYVGIFVLIGCICTACLILVIGKFSLFPGDQYAIHGYFSSASGLKTGARVEMAGVEIGSVAHIDIDKERYVARVVLNINNDIEISEDSIASVKTSGIIGEKYIAILPGGADIPLENGDEIYNTESSLDIESLIRKFIFTKEGP